MVSMCFAVVGILTMVVCGLLHEEFKRRHKVEGNLYKEKEINKFQKIYIKMTAVAIGIILFGLILSSGAVGLLVYIGVQKEKYQIKDFKEESKEEKKIGKICGVIMLVATGIFFLAGFLANRWDISWVAFPIGGLACAIASIMISKE